MVFNIYLDKNNIILVPVNKDHRETSRKDRENQAIHHQIGAGQP